MQYKRGYVVIMMIFIKKVPRFFSFLTKTEQFYFNKKLHFGS